MSETRPPNPTKTFGIRDASDLLHKLRYDTERLRGARFSHEVRYAAFDCGLTSMHIADWVLHSVAPERCITLCGKRAGEKRAMRNFIEQSAQRLPLLSTCQQIANSSKHLVLTIMTDDPQITARSTVRFEPPFRPDEPDTWASLKVMPVEKISVRGREWDAPDFFHEAAENWHAFLNEEGLMSARPAEPINIFS